MKSSLKSCFILSLLLLFTLGGCSYRILDFTVISSKNIDLTQSARFVKGKDRVKGLDKVHWIICVRTGRINMKEALDHAIESTPGCVALLDGVVHHQWWLFPWIYGQERMVVEGTPLIDPALVDAATFGPMFGKIELDKNGAVEEIESIAEAEYEQEKMRICKDCRAQPFGHSDLLK
jgi:hypothetical protein